MGAGIVTLSDSGAWKSQPVR